MKRENFPKRVARRQQQAGERQEAHDKLSPKEKLAKIDKKLGKGIGAIKERKRLGAR